MLTNRTAAVTGGSHRVSTTRSSSSVVIGSRYFIVKGWTSPW